MIYTSYFGNNRIPENLVRVAICQFPPKWYHGVVYRKLAPTKAMLKMSQEKYDFHMKRILDQLDPDSVIDEISSIVQWNPFVLLCYEKPPKYCHRSDVAKWLREAGYKVRECDFKGSEKFIKPEAVGERNVKLKQSGFQF